MDSKKIKQLISQPKEDTYAHSDIIFEFASWVLAEFKMCVIKDYKRFKSVDEDLKTKIDVIYI